MGKNRDELRGEILRKNAHLIDMFAKEERPAGSVYGVDIAKAHITSQAFATTGETAGVMVSRDQVECFSHDR